MVDWRTYLIIKNSRVVENVTLDLDTQHDEGVYSGMTKMLGYTVCVHIVEAGELKAEYDSTQAVCPCCRYPELHENIREDAPDDGRVEVECPCCDSKWLEPDITEKPAPEDTISSWRECQDLPADYNAAFDDC